MSCLFKVNNEDTRKTFCGIHWKLLTNFTYQFGVFEQVFATWKLSCYFNSFQQDFVSWDLPCVAVVDKTFKFAGICLFKSSGTDVLESTTFLTTSITLISVLHLKEIYYVNTIRKCERYTT